MKEKIKKHLENPLSRLLWQAIVIIFMAGVIWATMTGRITRNSDDLQIHNGDTTVHMNLEEKQDFILTKERSKRNETAIEKLQGEMKQEIKEVRQELRYGFEDLKDFIKNGGN